MKRTMKTGFIRDIKSSKGRFISIMLLMFISTFTLVGLKLVGPDIRATAAEYFDTYNMADISVMSSYGLSTEDAQIITDAVDDGEVEFGYFQDVTIGDSATALRVYSDTEQISKYELVDGTMPTTNDEIAITNQLASVYPLGSTITLTEKGDEDNYVLTNHQFTVVGYVNSMDILSTSDLGATTVGTGQLNGYGVVTPEVFDSSVYMIARITYDDLRGKDAFLDQYLTDVKAHKDELSTALADLPQERLDIIVSDANAEIADNEQKLIDAEAELDDAQSQLDDAEVKLADAKQTLDDSQAEVNDGQAKLDDGQTKINDGYVELESAQADIDQGMTEINTNQQTITDGQAAIDEARGELDSKQQTVTDSIAKLESGKAQYEDGIAQMQTAIAGITSQLADPSLTPTQVATLTATKAGLESQLDATQAEYDTFISSTYNPSISELNAGQAQITAGYQTLADKQAELDNGQAQLDAGLAELQAGQAQIDQGRAELAAAQSEIDENQLKLNDAQAKLNDGYAEYQAGLDEFNTNKQKFLDEEPDARKEIADGYDRLAEAKEDVANLDLPVYTEYTRMETPTSGGYQVFTSLATSIDKVANVFPILLYAVAALVTFTTMTRFVEDERINTGTLLSLGYSESEIKRKYIIYGALSSAIGSVIGIISGAIFIPILLYTAFRSDFTTPDLILTFDWSVAAIALGVSLLCAVIPAFLVTASEFKHSPASLLLPKPPADGSKILLERIPLIWNRLTFAHKVTARNIFRYKKRMFMTIFGVSGSVALLFTGLAMQGSIGNVADLQFGQVIQYDMLVVGTNNIDVDQIAEVDQVLAEAEIDSNQPLYIENLSLLAGPNDERQTITMMVADDFTGYVDFHDRKTGEQYQLQDGEVIITERLANILDLSVGDTITVNSAEDLPVDLSIGAITEMYTGHFIYANQQTYTAAFGEQPIPNSYVVNLADDSPQAVKALAIELMKLDGVQTVMQNESLIAQVNSMAESLNSVMSLLIVLSVMLAVVILYNITNINVSERMRELSTTKVLGYYDKEVTMYIYRETIILSLIGIVVGWIFGRIIHLFMMNAVSPLNMMFDQTAVIIAFIAPALLIIVVSVILGIIIHIRLKHVDMLEALKSVE